MLHIHRAERADPLADGLAASLRDPLDDPFMPDVVAVPTRGIERWLAQRLSTRLGASAGRADGVCANVEFPFPGRLIRGALAAATGIVPDQDPWLPERAVWPLLEVVDECLSEPWLSTLDQHLNGARGDGRRGDGRRVDDDHGRRRFAVIRHIADLFDRYGVHRPEMVRGWAAGEQPHLWQAELWRRLRARIGAPSPAERLPGACATIRERPGLLDLPPRLSLFGLTRLPRSYLDVLAAVAEHREVHLFVLHPSPVLWERVQNLPPGPRARHRDPTADLATNRLLASWGRDARELQLVIGATGPSVEHHHQLPDDEPETMLARIQADIRADREPRRADREPGPDIPPDNSIQIHACHGRTRQVEVLRDAILHLLDDDPTLEPRDVIVMCPDIETFAPLIQATFGAGPAADTEGEDGERLPDLRVRLADRSLRQTNPVLGVVSQLLALPDLRATASQLLDLAAREPVRRRFGFDEESLSRMQEWAVASGIRWGFDAPHREPFKLDGVAANTWRRGVDRVLAGVAMTEEDGRLLSGVLPLDDVESGAIELAGRFAEYVDRVRTAIDSLSAPKPIAEWGAAIAAAADALTANSDPGAWQRRELERILDDVVTESNASTTKLELADVRALLADRLRGRPTRANFRTGHLTVCTLVPMRSVPHRVVCVLGLDDGEFPRRARRDGDDLMLQEPHVGDRDPRSEDRQLLLDALMAATERLIITYTGNDERTNLPRPPAVPVGELLDAIERTVDTASRDQVLVRHPLQPFDPRNYIPGRLIQTEPWGFDLQALAGARALDGPRQARPPLLPARLPATDEQVIELERLIRFLERPARALLRDRLGIALGDYSDEVHDAMPVELHSLEQWGVGQRLLDGLIAGAELQDCMRAEIARGTLPPGELARRPLAEIAVVAGHLAEEAGALGDGPPQSLEVNLPLPDGRTLAGTVTGLCGDVIRAVSYSRVRPRDRVRAWVRLLALTASRPERPFESAVIGRARAGARGADVTSARIPPLADDAAGRVVAAKSRLEELIALYDRGMREPLPLACETSAAYVQEGEAAAREAWETAFKYDKEDRQPEHLLIYGGALPFAALIEDERFASYAHRLWDPLLSLEIVSDR